MEVLPIVGAHSWSPSGAFVKVSTLQGVSCCNSRCSSNSRSSSCAWKGGVSRRSSSCTWKCGVAQVKNPSGGSGAHPSPSVVCPLPPLSPRRSGRIYIRVSAELEAFRCCRRIAGGRDAWQGACTWAAFALWSRRPPLGMGASDTDTWRCLTPPAPHDRSRRRPSFPDVRSSSSSSSVDRKRRQIGSSVGSSRLASTWLGQPLIWNQAASPPPSRQATRMPRELPTTAVAAHAGFFDIFHNQVLVAAALASITAQLLKPVTSVVSGRGFDWRLITKSGGMPSSHSAAVTAMTTAVGIDRGWSDPLFGICVVFAAIVMYDAQGVRREVGKHAEVLNTIVVPELFSAGSQIPGNGSPLSPTSPPSSGPTTPVATGSGMISPGAGLFGSKDDEEKNLSAQGLLSGRVNRRAAGAGGSLGGSPLARPSSSRSEAVNESGPITPKRARVSEMLPLRPLKNFDRTERFWSSAVVEPSMQEGEVLLQEIQSVEGWRHIPLKESVGHTKLEVFVGGISGIVITLGMETIGIFPR